MNVDFMDKDGKISSRARLPAVRELSSLDRPELADPGLPKEEIGRWLYFAPFVVLSHDAAADPVFTYGNWQALIMFEMSWSELTALPSRLSAEPVSQAEGNRLLAHVTARGFVEHSLACAFRGPAGRVLIKDVTIWNLLNENSEYCSQAATYHEWIPADRVEPVLSKHRLTVHDSTSASVSRAPI